MAAGWDHCQWKIVLFDDGQEPEPPAAPGACQHVEAARLSALATCLVSVMLTICYLVDDHAAHGFAKLLVNSPFTCIRSCSSTGIEAAYSGC